MELKLTEEQNQRRQTLIDLRTSNYSILGTAMEREIGSFAASKPELSACSPDASGHFAKWFEHNRLAQLWSSVQCQGQEMMWDWAKDVVASNAGVLQDGPPSGPGSIELDPNLKMPDYFDVDFHLQPNGYQNSLSGFVYDTMVPLFYMGRMPVDHYAQILTAECPVTNPKRILDLAAGVGHSTLQWAQRFPLAEVHAIDLSGSMLQCLLWNARQRGLAVRCKQMNAEKLDYETGSFDVVTALLLMHELPETAIRNVTREARRVLRPNGAFVVADHVPISHGTSLFQAFHRWWDTHYNGEPYVEGFVRLDLPKLLWEEGFDQIEECEIVKPSGHAASALARAVIAMPTRQ
jgi:ubiquinone/menaquinone biosynthesis C-methylase UbiE